MEAYKIVTKPDYIEVIIEKNVDKEDIIATFYTLSEIKGFLEKNILWYFKGNIQPLNYNDTHYITKLTKSIYPANAPETKHAFVSDSTFVRAASKMFVKDASILPFVIKVFDDHDQAVQWLADAEQ
jgi:hypothetical protein